MKSKSNKITLLLISISVLILGCYKEIDLELPKPNGEIVINGLINTDDPIEINVSRTFAAYDKKHDELDFHFLDSAVVRLYENGTYVENMEYVEEGQYISPSGLIPAENKVYRLEVMNTDGSEANVTTTIPGKVKFEHVEHKMVHVGGTEAKRIIESEISFIDEVGEDNYYLFFVFCNEFLSDNDYSVKDNQGNSWEASGWANIYDCFDDQGFDGQEYKMQIRYRMPFDLTPPLFVKIEYQVVSMNEDMFRYLKSCEAQNNNDDNFRFTEPTFVNSNVENGLGTFAGYNIQTDSLAMAFNDEFIGAKHHIEYQLEDTVYSSEMAVINTSLYGRTIYMNGMTGQFDFFISIQFDEIIQNSFSELKAGKTYNNITIYTGLPRQSQYVTHQGTVNILSNTDNLLKGSFLNL
jgi:hypothetical protein